MHHATRVARILDRLQSCAPKMIEKEIQLRISESMFRGAFESSPHGMAIVALDGHIQQANQALCSIIGYERAELQSLCFQDITHRDDLAADLKHFYLCQQRVLDGYSMAKRYVRKDGSIVWIWLSAWMVRHPVDGTPVQFVSQIIDPVSARALLINVDEIAERRAIGDLDAGVIDTPT